MGILDDVAEQIADVFAADMLGRAATYNGASIHLVLTGKSHQQQGDPALRLFDATALVLAADVARPKRGDTVIVSGVTYRVESITDGDAAGATWTLGLIASLGVTL
jgi:hypothetical protein